MSATWISMFEITSSVSDTSIDEFLYEITATWIWLEEAFGILWVLAKTHSHIIQQLTFFKSFFAIAQSEKTHYNMVSDKTID